MKKRLFTKLAVTLFCLIGILLIVHALGMRKFSVEQSNYKGTILTRNFHNGVPQYGIVLINPNNVNDCVKITFDTLKNMADAGDVVYEATIDSDGAYVFLANEKKSIGKLIYISADGKRFDKEVECKNPSKVQLISIACGILFSIDSAIYHVSADGNFDYWGNAKPNMGLYPYGTGVTYQEKRDVMYLCENGVMKLFSIPENMLFRGWYEEGERIMLFQKFTRGTYIFDIKSGECISFSKFPFLNYGVQNEGILLEMQPLGSGGATLFDTEYTWSYLWGNDVFSAFTVSVFNKKNKVIRNFYYSDGPTESSWLPIDYNEEYFAQLKKHIELDDVEG